MTDHDGDNPAASGMLVPFVNVVSNGGVFPDDAFTAGFECGMIWQALGDAKKNRYVRIEPMTVRRANVEQIDLMAMNFGWFVETSEPFEDTLVDETGNEWIEIRLRAQSTTTHPSNDPRNDG